MSDTTPAPPAGPQPEPAKQGGSTARLAVIAPAFTTSFTLGDLTVTREGTDVPAADVDALKKTADKHGVTVAEVSE